MPDQIFEAFVWTANDLTAPTYWTSKDVGIKMLHDNTRLLLFAIILLKHLVQCCYNVESSPLIYSVNYCTGFYIIATLG